jgi:prepilin signal peptidase PulO-like enzyme (type II secretory pathway)
VELATALSFVLIFWYIFAVTDPNIFLLQLNWLLGLQLIGWWVFASVLVVIFVYDLRYYLILDKVSLPAVFFALIVNILLGQSWISLILAMIIGGGFFFGQFVLSKGKWIGGGDIRLGLLMGAILGWPGVLLGLFLAYILGGIFAAGLLLFRKKHWGDKLPFGTFLALATFIILLYGDILFNWYTSLWL